MAADRNANCGREPCRFRSSSASVSPPNWPSPRRTHAKHAARAFRQSLFAGLSPLEPVVNGDPARSVPYIVNLSFPGLDAETAIDAWSDLVAISNGAACTVQTYTCSHVLSAMRLPAWQQDGALRFSWCAETPEPDWGALVAAIEPYRTARRLEQA